MSTLKSALHALAFVVFGLLSLVAWGHHARSNNLPPAEELTGHLAEWRETPIKNSRGVWFLEFEFRTREHSHLFKIDRIVYSSRFRCSDCPGLKNPGKEGFSRSQKFGQNEKMGATLRFLADSRDMKKGRASVEIYALKTDQETYLSPKDSLDYLEFARPWRLGLAWTFTALFLLLSRRYWWLAKAAAPGGPLWKPTLILGALAGVLLFLLFLGHMSEELKKPDGALLRGLFTGSIVFGSLGFLAYAAVKAIGEWLADPFDSYGQLWKAADKGDLEGVRALIAKGLDVNRPYNFDEGGDSSGGDSEPPLVAAARAGALDVAEALVAAGSKVNAASDDEGFTPLIWGVMNGRADMVRFFLEKGAKVDKKSSYEDTALMHAAQKGYLEIAQVLLDNGAAPAIQDSDDKTALDYAKEQGHPELVKLLEAAPKPRVREKGT